MPLSVGVDIGGSKIVCIAGHDPHHIVARARFATGAPRDAVAAIAGFVRGLARPVAAVGVAAFGPLDLIPGSPSYGRLRATPKPGWNETDLLGDLRQQVAVPVVLDTDLNGAAFGELVWGAARDLHTFATVMVGTGIGGGAVVNGALLHGCGHPEMGHIRVPHDRQQDPFPGVCPHHGDCFEGLASGVAIAARWGRAGSDLDADHPAWRLEARYIGLALAAYVYTLAPQRIFLGGGVLAAPSLLDRCRAELLRALGGYGANDLTATSVQDYVAPCTFGPLAGAIGALALAHRYLDQEHRPA